MNKSDSMLAPVWRCRNHVFGAPARPLIMGILNVTPDSFSDGGCYRDKNRAVEHALEMVAAGVDIIDVGGESTRPGAEPVELAEELQRVIPVVEAIHRRVDVVLSVDTSKSEVAEQALAAGAHIINDVAALAGDAHMAEVARNFTAGVILMHRQGDSRAMQLAPHYEDVVREVSDFLRDRAEYAVAQGIQREALALDPGIGFGKTVAHNVALLGRLAAFCVLGRPLVVGLSRKRFLGDLTGRGVEERSAGGLGAMAFCLCQGARILRVHAVAETVDCARVVHALMEERQHVAD